MGWEEGGKQGEMQNGWRAGLAGEGKAEGTARVLDHSPLHHLAAQFCKRYLVFPAVPALCLPSPTEWLYTLTVPFGPPERALEV